ncbi:hypothetical protein [Streptomyces sp. NPDC057636]|uniref:hypothetical protein n=1 Tax=Streptomyces sp. NPDC057636 TaxID=3346189 RepID=UPI003690837A
MYLIANGHFKGEEYITVPGGVQVKRAARVSIDAAPEPLTKGKAITVNGSLTRADWVKHTYTGYGSQYVKLQLRTAGSTACTTVKTVKASTTGALDATVTASVDGTWRWVFGGTSTTGTAVSGGDYVDVR